jgi:epoxide hydrolase 4
MEIEEQIISTNGIHLNVALAGPKDGAPVVLLHGFPEFWRGWINQIEPLAAAGFRVIAPDQRGYNLSDKPAGVKSYRVEEMVKDVVGLLDALDYQQCCLVGHDWGAAVAWATAITHPQRVSRLVILNVPHPQVMQEYLKESPKQLLKSWYIGYFQIPRLPEWSIRMNNFSAAKRMLQKSRFFQHFTSDEIEGYKKAWSQPGALTGMINWYRAARYSSTPDYDVSVHMPSLIIWGKKDMFLSIEMAYLSMELCNRGSLEMLENASHWVQHDEPEKVNQLLLEFFE